MKLDSPALEQAFIRGVTHERMLEREDRLRNFAARKDQFGTDQLAQRSIEPVLRQAGNRHQKFIRELSSDNGTDLCDFPDRSQAVEARRQ